MRIGSDGHQELIAQAVDSAVNTSESLVRFITDGLTLPNGLAFDRDGRFIIANFGTDAIELMTRDGKSRTLFSEIDGEPIGKTNFVLRDSKDRIWVTVTTRLHPWTRSINEKTADGYIALIDNDEIRIVADGFVGTNEVRLDANEEWLYVVESIARRVSRLRLQEDGSLSDREVYGPDDLGGIPDGFAFDAYGNLWTTLVMADRLIAITPDREVITLLDDGDPEKVARFDRHFFDGTMTAEIMMETRGTIAPAMASVTFGGPDLKTVYLGSLAGSTIPYFRSPVAGLPLTHWK